MSDDIIALVAVLAVVSVIMAGVIIYQCCCKKSERTVNEEFRQQAMEIEKQLEKKGITIRF